MTAATSTEDNDVPRHSKLNALSMFFFGLTTAFLTASVFLILQYKQGIPFSFTNSLIVAVAAALIIPVITGFLFRRYLRQLGYPGIAGFIAANLIIAIGTGLFIF